MATIYSVGHLLTALALAPLAHGYRYARSPQPTFPGRLPDLGLSPAPTHFADSDIVPELLKRQDDSKSTCAYIYGASGMFDGPSSFGTQWAPNKKCPAGGIPCDPGYTCSTHPIGKVFHCCTVGTGDCYMPSACLDYTAFKSGLCSNAGTSTTCW